MDLALCYEKLLPERGGAERYLADLARRLHADGHTVHLYAAAWDAAALPVTMRYHRLPEARGPRFLRPWGFGAACARALTGAGHDVSIGFNKTWGQDVLYPQGGLHAASAEHNLRKHVRPAVRGLARLVRALDLANRSYMLLERRQYLGPDRPLVIANSRMVQSHFEHYYGIPADRVRVVHSAIDPTRFAEEGRPRRRQESRQRWGIGPGETVAAFLAMNYTLKGLEPLLHAVRLLPAGRAFRLLVAGGPRGGRYERLARQLGVADRVVFAGFCPDSRDCYFAADFLVHPTFYDPCSLVALEAQACGLPVVTSRFNGAAELMDPPNDGYVVEDPHDHARLAWCVTQLLDPARRAACSQAARRQAARWTFQQHYRRLLDVLTEAAGLRRAA